MSRAERWAELTQSVESELGLLACDDDTVTTRHRAALLAMLQTADFLGTQFSSKYGSSHLDHLGVPVHLRSALPIIKVAAVAALAGAASDRVRGPLVGAALLSYYSAAVSFHVLAGDSARDIVPAILCGGLAASLI